MKPTLPTQEEIKEAIEHRDALLDARAIIKTPQGRRFFKYLFRNYSPLDVPPIGLEETILREQIGHWRACNVIFALVSQADHEVSAQLLAEIQKEHYEKLSAPLLNGQTTE